MTLKITTWNVNSIKPRLDHFRKFIADENPDVIFLQELKCESEKFPHDELSDLPFNCYTNGQKTYNGVAICSKFPLEEIKTSFPGNPCPEQARYIEGCAMTEIGYVKFASLYAPNGGEVMSDKYQMKLEFYDAFAKYLAGTKDFFEKFIVGGDFNIAPFDVDVYSPKALEKSTCFTLVEREKLRTILNCGYEDLYRISNINRQEYSWWDYQGGSFEQNKGMRIDTIIGTQNLVQYLKSAEIHYNFRALQKPSDHAPVSIVLKGVE